MSGSPLHPSDRYHRQMLLAGIGEEGQQQLARTHIALVGCGALGCTIADLLVRAGIGRLTLIDRDLVELTNLQRQTLYTEDDARLAKPKAEAARDRLRLVNDNVTIDAYADDFNALNAERYLKGADLLLDGLDNFETRYLLNDLAVKHHLPYVYGGAVGTTGMSMVILPHSTAAKPSWSGHIGWRPGQSTPCLRCLFPEAPPPGSTPTCDTAGVLGPVVSLVAARQAMEAIKLCVGAIDAVDTRLHSFDGWNNEDRSFDVSSAWREGTCPTCASGAFEYLDDQATSGATSLCGRNAVQITPPADRSSQRMDLHALADRLAPFGEFRCNDSLLRGELRRDGDDADPLELTVFPNGRTIIKGTSEPEVARAIYARYIGT
ncbi:MAG: ThiF family adenylyltransferase [Planctomycetota bacterium]